MKCRMGHISNSSSSSFVLALDEIPDCPYDMMKMMFGSGADPGGMVEMYDFIATNMMIAKSAYKEVVSYSESESSDDMYIPGTDEDSLANLLSSRYYYLDDDHIPDPERWYGVDADALRELYEFEKATETGYCDYDKLDLLVERVALADARAFLEHNKGQKIVIVEYSDNDGPFNCLMEHGDVFRNLSHIRISKH